MKEATGKGKIGQAEWIDLGPDYIIVVLNEGVCEWEAWVRAFVHLGEISSGTMYELTKRGLKEEGSFYEEIKLELITDYIFLTVVFKTFHDKCYVVNAKALYSERYNGLYK